GSGLGAFSVRSMSALGQKQTSAHVRVMSALTPKADIETQSCDVRFVPIADIYRTEIFWFIASPPCASLRRVSPTGCGLRGCFVRPTQSNFRDAIPAIAQAPREPPRSGPPAPGSRRKLDER